MKNNEFKVTKSNDVTVYTLESVTAGSISSGSGASISKPIGVVRKRGDNLINQEAQDKEAPKPRNFVAKNAKMGGAGQHKDKKKEMKQGVAKHKKPYMEEMDDLKSQFLSMLKDKGIKHRVQGSPEQERQRTKDMIAQRGDPSKPSAPSTSSAYRDGFQDGLRGHRNPRASNIHGPMTNDYDSGYHAGVMKREKGVAEGDDRTVANIKNYERELAKYKKFNANGAHDVKIKNLEKIIANLKSKQGVAEGPNDGTDDNFNIDDIKRLEKIRDLETLKAQAKELIKGKPVRRMKPEKISFFYNRIDDLKNPVAVIKMMYDLMLAGEGQKVIGSRYTMSPNSYRARFGESPMEEGWGMGGYATAVASQIQPGKGVDKEMPEGDEYNEYDDEVDMVENNLHTIIRACKDLADVLIAGENMPEWVEEKISMAKQNMVTVAEYIQSQHEQGHVYKEAGHPDEKEDKELIRKMVKRAALKQETNDPYMAELHARLAEKIPKNAPVKAYIDDFAKAAKTPNAKGHHQFKNKSPEKVRQMAIAASYGAKNPSKKK